MSEPTTVPTEEPLDVPGLRLELVPATIRETFNITEEIPTDGDLTAAIGEVLTTPQFNRQLELVYGAWEELCRQVLNRAAELGRPAELGVPVGDGTSL